jgi:hypothetical protein
MATSTTTHTFTVTTSSIALVQGESLQFRLKLSGSNTANFTASISEGSLIVSSLAPATGYTSTNCPFLSTTYINTGSNNNEIVFTQGLSSLYGGDYIFKPNPPSGSISGLYATYGDIDYPFVVNTNDIVLIYLSDGTYLETRVVSAYIGADGLLRLTLDQALSQFVKDDLVGNGHTFLKILLLTRIEDETSAYITYTKRPGQTSYGFLIPSDISPEILKNIDSITSGVKQKLLADQQGFTQ